MTHSRFLLLPLLSLALLPCCKGQEDTAASPPPPAGGAQQSPAAALPPALLIWQKVLMDETRPEKFMSHVLENGGKFSEEDLEECEEGRQTALAALEAATALYHARIDLVRASVGSCYLGDVDELCEPVLAACEQLIGECFLCDLRALATGECWMRGAQLPPPARPGRQLLRFMPTCCDVQSGNVGGSNRDCDLQNGSINSLWESLQDNFMADYRSNFESLEGIDTFTGHRWQGIDGQSEEDSRRIMEKMLALLDREAEAWARYKEAMQKLTCPSRGYRGTGVGGLMTDYERHLLDSREMFLCMLATGAQGVGNMHRLPCFRRAELTALNPYNPYGEIFENKALLFRLPDVEGRPWCISFPQYDPGYIPVKDSVALRRFAAQNPEGGEAWVKGYQAIECPGTPYPESEDGPAFPEGGMAPQQLFVLLECGPEPRDEPEEP